MEIFLDALKDTAEMIPFLFIIYVAIEFIETNYGRRLRDGVQKAGKLGPVLGAVAGIVPQCGLSVVSSALYTQRILSLGTLLAVYISTSDEAIPIILSQPDKVKLIIPLLISKLLVAVTAGYAVDLFFRRSEENLCKDKVIETEICVTKETEDLPLEEAGCCGHSCTSRKTSIKDLLIHPIYHTGKVFFFILITSLIINFIIAQVGQEHLTSLFLGHSIFQPAIAVLIGLIPNCAASVAITEIFLKGGISFGSAVAGLSAGAGLGILVLFKENNDLKDTLKVIGLLITISFLAGVLIQYFYG